MRPVYLVCLVFSLRWIPAIDAHGRLLEPPSRSSAWRDGFHTPINYNDNDLSCGGLANKLRNEGRCGVCGDPWELRPPRPNEDGGTFGTKTIVRRYLSGQTIPVAIEITANHYGSFTFKLCCPHHENVDQACFDENLLRIEGSGHLWNLKSSDVGYYYFNVVLPQNLKCERSVLQWDWTTANQYGNCPDGTSRLGCGPQDTFRGCADVAIV